MGDSRRKALSVNALGVTYDSMLVSSKALECYFEALDIASRHKFQDLESKILNNIASVFSYLKDYETALSYLLEAYQKIQGTSEPIAVFLRNIANIYLEMGDYDKCYDYSILARNAAWREHDGEQRGDVYFFLALVFARRNRLRRAFRYFNLGFKLMERNHCFHSYAEGCYELRRFSSSRNNTTAPSDTWAMPGSGFKYGYNLLLKDIHKLSAKHSMTGDTEKELMSLREFVEICTSLESKMWTRKRAMPRCRCPCSKCARSRSTSETRFTGSPHRMSQLQGF